MKDDYQEFVELIKRKTGLDLFQYKEKQMKRRLTSLCQKRDCDNFVQYFHLIIKEKEYFNEFLDRITINVSEFYRNGKRWEVLEKKILPKLLRENRNVKIWSAACSTGEEPYTIAMLLHPYINLNQVNILATDLDENALQAAKRGIYLEKSLKEVPSQIKQKHFSSKDGNFFSVDESLKKCITFKKHNLLKDPYEEKFDLIVCRNVLIYFTEEAKEIVYRQFSQSLKPGGVLFVGSTEQIFNPKQYGLETVDTFFYQKQ
ncbi:chemotaxis protein methyltransferase CheR [Salirhabdus euzebyi]|uniref:protein-glutamate O-methyltransferase n=1 Tax=Salirhabdus euzebyi TaxID=394506 RepID=A0A841PXL0_9BACI|nr:protein-glutamate O-methyltransferase CheR [Salirhabdus euzebyi]MBB6452206.1 chemotaxis protein methyltransferase CheR [Salirhabdus euzebyi]